MDKIKINNQVVLMRKFVKQAKVHVINKLVKQVKLLQHRKGSEDQVRKAKRKAERFLEEIALIKRITPDSVSKLALSKAKIWKDVLQQKDVSLEDRCLAMLANYEPVQKEVEQFHNMNENLVVKIPDLLKEWEERNKTSSGEMTKRLKASEIKQKKKEKKLKSKFKATSKTYQAIPQNNSVSNLVTDNEKETFISTSESTSSMTNLKETKEAESKLNIVKSKRSEIKTKEDSESQLNFNSRINIEHTFIDNRHIASDNDSMCNTDSPHDNTATDLKKNEKSSFILSDSSINEDDECESFSIPFLEEGKKETVSESDASEDSEIIESNKKEINKSLGAAELNIKKKITTDSLKAIAVLNLDELKDFEEIPLQGTTDSEESEEESGNLKSDPFFLGRNETVPIDDQKVEQTDNERSKYTGDRSLFNSHKSNMSNKGERGASFKGNKILDSKHSSYNNNFRNGFKNRAERRKAERNFSNFQGNSNRGHKFEATKEKNIVKNKRKNNFGDRERDTKIFAKDIYSKYPNKTYYNDFNNKNSVHKEKQKFSNEKGKLKFQLLQERESQSSLKDKSSEKPLHPSWEAKRKLKEATASTGFKGKRIVFDD